MTTLKRRAVQGRGEGVLREREKGEGMEGKEAVSGWGRRTV